MLLTAVCPSPHSKALRAETRTVVARVTRWLTLDTPDIGWPILPRGVSWDNAKKGLHPKPVTRIPGDATDRLREEMKAGRHLGGRPQSGGRRQLLPETRNSAKVAGDLSRHRSPRSGGIFAMIDFCVITVIGASLRELTNRGDAIISRLLSLSLYPSTRISLTVKNAPRMQVDVKQQTRERKHARL